MKRLITSMLIVLLLCVAFIGSFYKGYYCYAIENEDSYRALTNDELDAALYAYMQSRGGGLSSITYEAMHTYNRGKIDNFIFGDGAEYSRSDLLGHIHVGKNQNDGMYFDFDGIAAGFLNTRFRKMLQDKVFGENASLNENGMFEDGVEDTLYSGQYFVDNDGIGCLCYMADEISQYNMSFTSFGTPYKYTPSQIISLVGDSNYTFTFNLYSNKSVTKTLTKYTHYYTNSGNSYTATSIRDGNSYNSGIVFYQLNEGIYNNESFTRQVVKNGQYAIVSVLGEYYFCSLSQHDARNYPNGELDYKWYYQGAEKLSNSSTNATNTNIIFYTNVNNNIVNYPDIDADGHLYIQPKVKINGEYSPYTVNNNQTINQVINNYYNDGSEKDKTITVPSTTPDSGSGGGSSGGTLPNWSNPYPNLSPDGNGGFNFNFSLPDLNIDWNISGLSEKFPFSIPFDLIRFVSILNAEPETPHFEGTVNLIVYEWNIDADLSDFDNLAGIVRNVEFIGFCITLILITRRMIKG